LNDDVVAGSPASEPRLLAEAIAWWRVGGVHGRRALVDAAVKALLAGSESAALAELAGIPPDESPFAIEALIDRVSEEEGLDDTDADARLLAARWLCRALLSGQTSERDLTRWVHDTFSHESSSDELDRLAELDDDFDLSDTGMCRGAEELTARVREAARRFLKAPDARGRRCRSETPG
jgi:hypothetical protein